MRAVGRLLRTLRLAAGLSLDDTAIACEVSPERLRQLEAGLVALEYLEATRLTKGYLLCPTCFRRLFDAAMSREGIIDE